MCAAAAELEMLGELLSEDHDLHLLRQVAIKKSIDPDLELEANRLVDLIDSRQRELQTAALKPGKQFFHEKPSDFCQRLHGYWKRWKSKKQPRDHRVPELSQTLVD